MAATPFVAVAAFFGLWSWIVLDNLWAPYKDGRDSTYLIVAGLLATISLANAFIAGLLLQGTAAVQKCAAVAVGLLIGLVVVASVS